MKKCLKLVYNYIKTRHSLITKIKTYTNEELTFFVTLDKLTDELILQEGGLISLKIPKQWQKPCSVSLLFAN